MECGQGEHGIQHLVALGKDDTRAFVGFVGFFLCDYAFFWSSMVEEEVDWFRDHTVRLDRDARLLPGGKGSLLAVCSIDKSLYCLTRMAYCLGNASQR